MVNPGLFSFANLAVILRLQENWPTPTETASPSVSATQDLYWVLETQASEAPYTVVHFYNAQNEKIYESRYEGLVLDIEDRQTRLMMDELATFVKNKVWKP